MNTRKHHAEAVSPVKKRTLVLLAGAAGTVLLICFIVGFLVRHARVKKREEMAKEMQARPLVVEVIAPTSTSASFDLTLPADVRAYAAAALYTRTNGYLASWTADINDHVKRGDILAVISAPDTDAELEQARAALNQQQTNYQLAIATDERFRGLIATHGITQQQLDQNRSAREQAKANVVAAQANVDRMQALVSFEKIVAPFDGVVTARTYDVGALLTASNVGAGQELFDVAEDDRLRVFVNVPQPYAQMVKFGQPVALTFERNYPGHRFTGVVTRSSASLDPATRTLRTELEFKNTDPDHHIFPGMYGEAIFTLYRNHPVITIPTSALLFEANGKQVATIGDDHKVHFQTIVPGNDFGTDIEVLSGLQGHERIVSNPGEELVEGLVVSPQAENPDATKPKQSAPP